MSEQLPEEKYQKGFNDGYLITKHLPELSDKLTKIKSESPWMQGFHDGRIEQVQEQVRATVPQAPEKDNHKNIQPVKSKEDKDKDLDR